MIELLQLILHLVASLFKSRAKLEAEILVLRQQLNVLRRQVSQRPQLNNADRFLLVWLYRWFPSILDAIAILRPETIIRWHRGGSGHTGAAVRQSCRQTEDLSRTAQAHSRDEPRKSPLGCATHPG
jgi:hypothetical protein